MEKGILFNTEMVQAILEGRKTSTRRIIKQQPTMHDFGNHKSLAFVSPITVKGYEAIGVEHVIQCASYLKLPYQVGDILYVRETWWCNKEKDFADSETILYKADFPVEGYSDASEFKWHPSIHMPREAARIFLKVTDVKAQRIQDITEEDISKEGLSPYDDRCADENWHPTHYDPDSGGIPQLRQGFETLWNSTVNKKDIDKYGWDANPWVWVIEFERIEKSKESDRA